MRFMNEWDVGEAVVRFDRPETPNLSQAATVLSNLMEWTNRNSDGWPYWAKPARSAARLMELLESVDRYNPQDVTLAEVRKALSPVKAFLTRQGVNHEEVL